MGFGKQDSGLVSMAMLTHELFFLCKYTLYTAVVLFQICITLWQLQRIATN